MPRRKNYAYEKIQRERAKAAKREAKRQAKAARTEKTPEQGDAPDADASEGASAEGDQPDHQT